MILGRTLLPQILWIKKCRKHYGIALLLAFFVVSGTLLERLIILLTTLYRDYLPSSWAYYTPGGIELLATLLCYIPLVLLVSLWVRRKTRKEAAQGT